MKSPGGMGRQFPTNTTKNQLAFFFSISPHLDVFHLRTNNLQFELLGALGAQWKKYVHGGGSIQQI